MENCDLILLRNSRKFHVEHAPPRYLALGLRKLGYLRHMSAVIGRGQVQEWLAGCAFSSPACCVYSRVPPAERCRRAGVARSGQAQESGRALQRAPQGAGHMARVGGQFAQPMGGRGVWKHVLAAVRAVEVPLGNLVERRFWRGAWVAQWIERPISAQVM